MVSFVDRGSGLPLVLIPGLQGRWEYLRRTVKALSQSFRVLTFSLQDEPRRPRPGSPKGLDCYTSQILTVMDRCHLENAIVCGVSFGGRIAVRFAAEMSARTQMLVLVSPPGPRWHLSRRHAKFVRRPLLYAPVFFAASPGRLRREIATALPDERERRRFMREQLHTLATAPLSPTGMAARAHLMELNPSAADCSRIKAPTLVISGEPGLDHVVPVDGTSEYLQLIKGARHVMLERTGHLGSITRPEAFAAIIRDFVHEEQMHVA